MGRILYTRSIRLPEPLRMRSPAGHARPVVRAYSVRCSRSIASTVAWFKYRPVKAIDGSQPGDTCAESYIAGVVEPGSAPSH